jgi:acyl carrier protein
MNEHNVTVRAFIVDNFLFGNAEGFSDDTSFIEEGIIDSTGILELVSYLEQTYSIRVEDQELIPENLDSVVNIDQFLKRKLNHSN